MNDIYFEILKDSFKSHFAFTISDELAFPLAIVYSKADVILCSVAGMAGSVAGLSLTYFMFFALAKLLKKLLETNPGYPTAQHYVNKFTPVICLLSAIPALSVIPAFFCGLTKVKYSKFLIFTLIYRCFYYIYMINGSIL